MVAQIGWLKARLTWNGLRRDRQRRIGLPLVLGLMVYVSWRLATSYSSAFARLDGPMSHELALWAALAIFIGWISLPVVIFPLDETLDPARLAVFPIPATDPADRPDRGLVGIAQRAVPGDCPHRQRQRLHRLGTRGGASSPGCC